MSHALLRRNSSKQGLQNLMRLTAQRSIEDAEEVERERRRRAREDFRRRNSGSTPEESSPESETLVVENLYSSDLKPSCSPSLEEDEGFSDWTQRRERRRQQRLQQLSQGAEDEEDEEDAINKPIKTTQASFTSSGRFQRQQEEEEDEEDAVNKPMKTAQASFTSSGRFQRQQEEEEDEEDAINKPIKTTRASFTSSGRFQRQQEEEAEERDRNRKEEEEGWAIRAARERKEKEEEEEKRKREMKKRREEIQKPKSEVEKRKEVKVSYTSKVFLQQEPKHDTNGDTSNQEVTSHINRTRTSTSVHSRATEPEESQAILETEQRLEKIRRSLQAKESQEMEQLRQRQVEAEQELEKLQRRREERRRVREQEERRREEEEQQRLLKEEEERRRMKEDIERRRMEAAERMKSLSSSSVDGDEAFSPISPKAPTHKISERTESLNRSLKKSNSFKKMQPLLLTAKIDDKLEQYAHAVENSQEARAVKASLTDLPSSPEVASKKNLFEAGEAWNQSPTKPMTCKDTEGLKVGVAGLITQWVKGPSDTSRQPLCRPADVKSGDVMQKKNMWEIIGDSSGRLGQGAKGQAGGKKYKFVITGHGKYEKIPVDDENGGEFTNGKSGLFHTDY